MMTMQDKLKSLEGKKVTIVDHFARSVKTATGILVVTPTEEPPGSAYISVEGDMGAYLAGWGTTIGENSDEITIITGARK